MSRLEISELANLSPGTVTNVISQLLDEKLVLDCGLSEIEIGRPRELLSINPRYGYLIGVDLGETQVQTELYDLSWKKLGVERFEISQAGYLPEAYTELIGRSIQEMIRVSEIDSASILGVGVAVPGIVEHNGAVRIVSPLWGWKVVDFLGMLEEKIHLPVYIDNGAKAMALAEYWIGAGRKVTDAAVILIGTGIGAGMITKGELYRGATNSAGEWGHTKIVLEGRPCRCGSRGCLEAYAGAPGIIRSYREAKSETNDLPTNQLKAMEDIVSAYQQNEPEAVRVLHETSQYLGAGLANLVNLFNPQLIVIGGWAGLMLGKTVLNDLKEYTLRYSLPPSVTSLKIELGHLGDDAICIGAAFLVLQEFLSANRKFLLRSSMTHKAS